MNNVFMPRGAQSKSKLKNVKEFVKNNKAKCLFAIVLAGLILSIPAACSSSDRKFKDFELVNAIALDEPEVHVRRFLGSSGVDRDYDEEWDYINPLKGDKEPANFVFDDEKIVFDASVSVDVNNDGKHDLWLHIITRDDKIEDITTKQNYALQTIQKGSKLVLEGVVERDIVYKDIITNVIYPGNGSEVGDGYAITDNHRGAHYIDMQNLVAIDNVMMKEPMNKKNRKIFEEQFFQNQR